MLNNNINPTMSTLLGQSSDILGFIVGFLDTPHKVQVWQVCKRFHYVVGELVAITFVEYNSGSYANDRVRLTNLVKLFKKIKIVYQYPIDPPITDQVYYRLDFGGHDYNPKPYIKVSRVYLTWDEVIPYVGYKPHHIQGVLIGNVGTWYPIPVSKPDDPPIRLSDKDPIQLDQMLLFVSFKQFRGVTFIKVKGTCSYTDMESFSSKLVETNPDNEKIYMVEMGTWIPVKV